MDKKAFERCVGQSIIDGVLNINVLTDAIRDELCEWGALSVRFASVSMDYHGAMRYVVEVSHGGGEFSAAVVLPMDCAFRVEMEG